MVNKVILVGRLGKDPEVRSLDNGAMVANFSVATSEHWKDQATGEKKEKTEWHNLVLWRGLAEVAQKYLHKGDLVYIEGKMTTRSWEKDGVTRYTTEVVVNELKMLGSKKEGGSSHGPAPDASQDPGQRGRNSGSTGGNERRSSENQSSPLSTAKEPDDDLPF